MGGEMGYAKKLEAQRIKKMLDEERAELIEKVMQKPSFSLLPSGALWQTALAMTLGAEKHVGDDFTKPDSGRTVNGEMNAAFRHYYMWRTGFTHDCETGLHPLAHAAARCLIACELALRTGE